MSRPATDGGGRHLADLVRLAIPPCRAAQAQSTPKRRGPGRPRQHEEWHIALLIFVAVLKGRKSKSAQWRFLAQHARELCRLIGVPRLPARSTFMARYRDAHALFERAVTIQGRTALKEHVSSARTCAVDKSLIPARGPCWPNKKRRKGIRPKGLDDQAAWGYSPHDGWVWGYSYEVVVCATPGHVVLPLLASAGLASAPELRTFPEKVPLLPPSCRDLVLDAGYDSNAAAELVEYRHDGTTRTGRHYICPLQARANKPPVGRTIRRGDRERLRRHRAARERFYHGKQGRRLYARRGQSVEPFNQWFKHLYGLEDHAWHRGLDNNRTMLLAGIFAYQTLLRHAHRLGRRDGRIQWILDGL